MDASKLIEKYCKKIREKFYSNRKMTFDQKVAHARNVVETLNFGSDRQLNPDFIIKILGLEEDTSIEYYS